MRFFSTFFTMLVLLNGCGWKSTAVYRAEYQHLPIKKTWFHPWQESDYFLVIFVDAPHLDYTSNRALIQTIAKHPNGCKNRRVGHSWIYLKGLVNGKPFTIEGGHSGELGLIQPKYFDGIMDLVEQGDPNPIKYLWTVQRDGFFQKGRGEHQPTFAVKIDLNNEQFKAILEFIESYDYRNYSLVDQQCCSFVVQIALLAGISLEYEKTIKIDSMITLKKERIMLWHDPRYSFFTFGCPDVLEKSLIEATQINL